MRESLAWSQVNTARAERISPSGSAVPVTAEIDANAGGFPLVEIGQCRLAGIDALTAKPTGAESLTGGLSACRKRGDETGHTRQAFLASLDDPHLESLETAAVGLQAWSDGLAVEDGALLDPAAGVPLHWVPGEG